MYANLLALLMARLPFDLSDEEGQGLAEYGLILVFIALVVIAGMTLLGNNLNTLFNGIGGKLTMPAAPGGS